MHEIIALHAAASCQEIRGKKSISLMAASNTVVIMTRCTLISPSACDWGQHTLAACRGGNHSPSLPLISLSPPPLLSSAGLSLRPGPLISPPQLDRGSMKTSRQYDYITSCVLPKKSGKVACCAQMGVRCGGNKSFMWVKERKVWLLLMPPEGGCSTDITVVSCLFRRKTFLLLL